MKTIKMSGHAKYDRADRAAYLGMKVGFGEDRYTVELRESPERYGIITSTGIIKIFSKKDGALITFYLGNPAQITALFNGKVPHYLSDLMIKYKTNGIYHEIREAERKGYNF